MRDEENYKKWYEKNKEKITQRNKEWYEKNKEEIKKRRENSKDKRKQYCEKNKEEIKRKRKEYRENNKEKIKERRKELSQKHKKAHSEYAVIWRNRGQNGQIDDIRKYTRDALFKNRKTCKFEYYLGCDRAFFKQHIESLFLNGMNWNNYGNVWNLDHIIPISSFDLSDEEQKLIACNYKNVQPLFCTDNFSKSDKIDGIQFRLTRLIDPYKI